MALTSTYEFTTSKPSRGGKTRSAYQRAVAVVYGTLKGVPFRTEFKRWDAAERFAKSMFGSELFPL